MRQRKCRPIKYTRRYSYAKIWDVFFGPPGIYIWITDVSRICPEAAWTDLHQICLHGAQRIRRQASSTVICWNDQKPVSERWADASCPLWRRNVMRDHRPSVESVQSSVVLWLRLSSVGTAMGQTDYRLWHGTSRLSLSIYIAFAYCSSSLVPSHEKPFK